MDGIVKGDLHQNSSSTHIVPSFNAKNPSEYLVSFSALNVTQWTQACILSLLHTLFKGNMHRSIIIEYIITTYYFKRYNLEIIN